MLSSRFARPVSRRWLQALIALAILPTAAMTGNAPELARPNVLIVTIDTLRADRLSSYGYERPTSPHLDRLIEAGVRFDQARTVEPLTSPALCSMMTSMFPHENGASRNGLRIRPGLPSLPRLLAEHGYRTAAFVSNWTLRDKISGLGAHFERYDEVLRKKRWLGLVSSEATAEDVNAEATSWLLEHREDHADRPFLLWVHYTEPHAPYKLHKDHLEHLGIEPGPSVSASDRYDSEVAAVDQAVGRLLAQLGELYEPEETLVVFVSDHGESLGEHGYWGHGRHLYEPSLRIPMSLTWPGRIEPGAVAAPAMNLDLAPTIASLLDLPVPALFRGLDWTPVLDGGVPPLDRATHHQAHKGAVLSRHDSDLARRSGLLEVAVVQENTKEIYRIKKRRHRQYDLARDPLELEDLTRSKADPSENLQLWIDVVDAGLTRQDDSLPQPLDEETAEQLRALGYAD